MNCLWLARDLPFPPDAGDRIYSARLAGALAEAGASVRFFGFADADPPPATLPLNWVAVAGTKRRQAAALFSHLPIAAAIHDTVAYRRALAEQLRERWDAVVLDSYGSGWALPACLATRSGTAGTANKAPLLVYVAHNQEGALWQGLVRNSRATPLKRAAIWQNWLKVRALERRLLQHADLTTAISDEDAAALAPMTPKRPPLLLTPGYSGARLAARVIDGNCPRRVVLIGSFRWLVKQENLRRFVALADPVFHRHGIAFDVIGDVPQALLDELRPRLRATVFHGFVEDVAPCFARARMAVVPEAIGGGFKLKFLDYLFSRLPVASLAAAAAGLPPAIREHLLIRADLAALVDTVVAQMDDLDRLNSLQRHAYAAAAQHFDWRDRGAALHQALLACRLEQPGVATAPPETHYRMELP